MTLFEVCEPLFQYVCRLNRSARKGGGNDMAVVRQELAGLFDRMKAQAMESKLVDQYERVDMPLLFFVDSMIAESKLAFSGEWNKARLAYQKNELAGDEKFFDLLEKTLAETTEAASERLVIFYTCMGLGFQGWYAGQPDYLHKKMKQIAPRITRYVNPDAQSRVCPKAYENLDTRNLIEPPSRKLVGIVIALVGLTIVLFVTNMILYRQASDDLSQALQRMFVNERARTEGAAALPKEGADRAGVKP